MPEISNNAKVPIMQDDAILNQAAPVQNTWYTVLDTTLNVALYYFLFRVVTTGEDLEVRLTIDGLTRTISLSAVADTFYEPRFGAICTSGTGWYSTNTTTGDVRYWNTIFARSLKIEIRKTTAAGAGNIQMRVIYGKW